MTLSTAIDRLQVHAAACTGVKYVPTEPPESLGALPAVVIWPERGEYIGESFDWMREFHTIVCDFVTPRTMLNLATTTHLTFIDEFARKVLGDPTLNSAVSTIAPEGPLTYEIFVGDWGATKAMFTRFRLRVKIRGQVST